MSTTSERRAREFLAIAGQFRLGELVTEASHALTSNLSHVAQKDAAEALRLLFEVDLDVLNGFEAVAASGRIEAISRTVVDCLAAGRNVYFTGCGSTGRLSILLESVWRDYWQRNEPGSPFENRVFGVMAGGDFGLIKAVEGFEDFASFGRRQIAEMGVGAGDVVFAVTEGGETSFVIGTAWEALERGARVYFVYNNPDDVLCRLVERSRAVIEDPRIEKVNLTTGPMAVSGSTRMQATSIELCVLASVLEYAVRSLSGRDEPAKAARETADELRRFHAALLSDEVLRPLADVVCLEEDAYRRGCRCNYYADGFAVDVLTDTTERSPTYSIPPFRKSDDPDAADSWAFLFVPEFDSPSAWRHILKREPRCLNWTPEVVKAVVPPEQVGKVQATVSKVGQSELMRFKTGHDGLGHRRPGTGDCAVAVFAPGDSGHFQVSCLEGAEAAGAGVAVIAFSTGAPLWPEAPLVHIPRPKGPLLLDAVTRIGVKMLLNALSTCVMARLGRVVGNSMVWVVPSNLKLIDRSVRYVARLADLDYETACRVVFEAIEYVEPRMKADQAYPPVVRIAVLRAGEGLDFEEAERRLAEG